jgi:hypothetical protein
LGDLVGRVIYAFEINMIWLWAGFNWFRIQSNGGFLDTAVRH